MEKNNKNNILPPEKPVEAKTTTHFRDNGIIVDGEVVSPTDAGWKPELEEEPEFMERTGKQTLLLPKPKAPAIAEPKKQYTPRKKRDWRSYNQSQVHELELFMRLIFLLIRHVGVRDIRSSKGRPFAPLRDMVFAIILKVYNEKSFRRNEGLVGWIAYLCRYMRKRSHYNTAINYMGYKEMTPYLRKMIKETASIMSPYEDKITIDATGISTFIKKHWVDDRLNEKEFMSYKKLQIISGVDTHIILSAGVYDGETSEKDKEHFETLLNEMPNNFVVKEMTGDGAYYVGEFAEIVKARNIEPYFKPQKNASTNTAAGVELRKMVRKWKRFREEWNKHYHQRSNVESTIGSIKRKHLAYARSRTDTALTNEILCKVICHNLTIIIRGIFERGVDVSYLD